MQVILPLIKKRYPGTLESFSNFKIDHFDNTTAASLTAIFSNLGDSFAVCTLDLEATFKDLRRMGQEKRVDRSGSDRYSKP